MLRLNLALCLLLFLPAGTFAWPQAWIFRILFDACSLAIGFWLRKTNPDLAAEREKSPLSANQAPLDRAVMAAILLFFAAWLVFIALDARRLHWSHAPLSAQGVGAILIVATFWGWAQVLAPNSFTATTMRVRVERGQRARYGSMFEPAQHRRISRLPRFSPR